MICNSYDALTIVEKTQLTGKLLHLVMSDEETFKYAKLLVDMGERNGLLTDVTILPNTNETDASKEEIV